jgi:hypothetical protein
MKTFHRGARVTLSRGAQDTINRKAAEEWARVMPLPSPDAQGYLMDSAGLGLGSGVFADRLRAVWPSMCVIKTRCAGTPDTGHSVWAYGPVYVCAEAARDDGHVYEVECRSCWTARDLL